MNKQVVLIIIIGFIGFLFLKYSVEPFVIDTACAELIKCNNEG